MQWAHDWIRLRLYSILGPTMPIRNLKNVNYIYSVPLFPIDIFIYFSLYGLDTIYLRNKILPLSFIWSNMIKQEKRKEEETMLSELWIYCLWFGDKWQVTSATIKSWEKSHMKLCYCFQYNLALSQLATWWMKHSQEIMYGMHFVPYGQLH